MIRIISGIHKGRRIQAPKNLPVRPTTDRAKESLFNVLGHHVDWEDTKVLDLFAGTGNISYECASRGCPRVIAVDMHPGCVRFITQTAERLSMPVVAYRREVMKFLEQCGETFTLIFADPPYDLEQESLEKIVAVCREKEVLAKGGLLVIEHSPHRDLSALEGFQQVRKYGNTLFAFFSW